jgi:hypothetical protein
MKRIVFIMTIVISAVCCKAQAPVFQSPYKDGRPVAESQKDYSQPVKINLLNSAGRNSMPVKQKGQVSNEGAVPVSDDKAKPVFLNPSKSVIKQK